MNRAESLIGTIHPDRHSYTARRLYRGGAPERIVPVLRQIWRDVFDGDTDRMLQRLLAQDWEFLDPGCAGPVAGPDLVAGIGKMDWSGPPDREVGDLRNTRAAVGHAWAYLVDDVDDHLLVFEASVHGRWLWQSRHRLQAAFDGLRSSPAPIAGDAATAGHVGHAWRPAVVSLDGLHTAWPAEVCTGEHARGVVVARFDTDTLDEVIDVLDLFHRDRRPGSGLPVMSRTGRQLTVRWFAGTGHDNYLHVLADVDVKGAARRIGCWSGDAVARRGVMTSYPADRGASGSQCGPALGEGSSSTSAGHGSVPALKHTPLPAWRSFDGVVVTGVGQAAWRYSWMSPPSTSARSMCRSCAMLKGGGSAAVTGVLRSMPRCGRAVF